MNTVVKDRQSLLDLAIIKGGSIETVMAIAEANGLSLSEDLKDGMVIEIPAVIDSGDSKTAGKFSILGLEPATGVSNRDIMMCPTGGINFMGIEVDFIVS